MNHARFLSLNALEWDAEWPGPRVIVEVSEKAPNANGTNVESKDPRHPFSSLSSFNKCFFFRDFFFFLQFVELKYSWTKNHSSNGRGSDCCCGASIVGWCNCLIFQSMGKNSHVGTVSAKISAATSSLMSSRRNGSDTSS